MHMAKEKYGATDYRQNNNLEVENACSALQPVSVISELIVLYLFQI